MDDIFHITVQEIDEAGVLHLHAEGRAVRRIANHKLRIIAVFQAGSAVRRFPMDAACVDDGKAVSFRVEQMISLRDIFYEVPDSIEKRAVAVEFEYCDAAGVWTKFSERIELSGAFFQKQKGEHSFIRVLARRAAYAACTLLLPVWLLDGWLVVKGYKKSPYVDEEVKGKKNGS